MALDAGVAGPPSAEPDGAPTEEAGWPSPASGVWVPSATSTRPGLPTALVAQLSPTEEGTTGLALLPDSGARGPEPPAPPGFVPPAGFSLAAAASGYDALLASARPDAIRQRAGALLPWGRPGWLALVLRGDVSQAEVVEASPLQEPPPGGAVQGPRTAISLCPPASASAPSEPKRRRLVGPDAATLEAAARERAWISGGRSS